VQAIPIVAAVTHTYLLNGRFGDLLGETVDSTFAAASPASEETLLTLKYGEEGLWMI
jgi:hypothetical protein